MNNFQIYIFGFIFIILNIEDSKCDNRAQNTFNYKCPNCIELNNGNILIIFSKRISIYNSDLSNEVDFIKNNTGFSLEDSDLNLINLSSYIYYKNLFIYIFINRRIYISY